MQVQAAIAEARAGGRGREALENGHVSSSARSSTPRAGAPAAGSSSGAATPLAEGTETALLYVRFRAAAEPGLKGVLYQDMLSATADNAASLAQASAPFADSSLDSLPPFKLCRLKELQ